MRNLTKRRIVFDGRAITGIWLERHREPETARVLKFVPEEYGDGLVRPTMLDFPWDVAQLPRNVWDVPLLLQNVAVERIEIRRTDEGDFSGSYPLVNTDHVKVLFECPRRFAFNVARLQVINEGQREPAQQLRIEWKQTPKGLWFVRSLDDTRVLREGGSVRRVRDILKYTDFEPNARISAENFPGDPLKFIDNEESSRHARD